MIPPSLPVPPTMATRVVMRFILGGRDAAPGRVTSRRRPAGGRAGPPRTPTLEGW